MPSGKSAGALHDFDAADGADLGFSGVGCAKSTHLTPLSFLSLPLVSRKEVLHYFLKRGAKEVAE